MYYERIIDQYLSEWAARSTHKPVLLRGARQVGKSTAVRHLGEQFKYFVEINLEKQQDYQALFQKDLDVKRIVPQMAAMHGTPIIPGVSGGHHGPAVLQGRHAQTACRCSRFVIGVRAK